MCGGVHAGVMLVRKKGKSRYTAPQSCENVHGHPGHNTPHLWFDFLHILYFFNQTLWLLFFFLLLILVRVLFEDGIYFLGKPADINDGLIRYVRVRW